MPIEGTPERSEYAPDVATVAKVGFPVNVLHVTDETNGLKTGVATLVLKANVDSADGVRKT